MKPDLTIGQRVTVRSSRGRAGHTVPDHEGIITHISGPYEHMGNEYWRVGVKRLDHKRVTHWPDHQIETTGA